ncbi:MAG TPA: TetR/AcrR family transcriptional regulator [Bacteroidales bacterium]|nr:TetR/AcrR family transcriptional regulator [Bacteroidales bacterium]
MTTKDQILVEARKVFEKYGYNKTSLADIAYAAQKGRRTLYTYFNNKEEIFKAVIEIEIEGLVEKMQEFINRPLLADEKLRQYMHMRMNAVKQLTMYFDAIRRDLVDNLGVIERIRKKYDEMEITLIKQMLDQGVEQNVFDIADTHLVASAVVLAVKGFELPLIFGESSFDHDRLIDPLITLFYKGIHVNISDNS